MAAINYHNRYFKMISSSSSDASADDVIFHYRQEGDIVWGTFSGGTASFGTLIAHLDGEGSLDLDFQFYLLSGELVRGNSQSKLIILEDGRYRLEEDFTFIDGQKGFSVVEEFYP